MPVDQESSDSQPSGGGSSSIFGGAKPVDTTKKEREIEEKLATKVVDLGKNRSRTTSERSATSEEDKEKESSSRPAPSKPSAASIFGGAKPVDTTKREKEIEEKLKKLEVSPESSGASSGDKQKEKARSGADRNRSGGDQNRRRDDRDRDRDRDRRDHKNDRKSDRSPPPIKKIEEAEPPVSLTQLNA